jgi:ubiquinone/menaquinone biosynthesis C-methylase UbiE
MPRVAQTPAQPIIVSRPKKEPVPYILGHSENEIRRLMLQSAILKPITARLLNAAGVVSGMRVLDLGCGTGDVSMLAAELVGPTGAVVGIDRSADVLAVARERARIGNHSNIEFAQGDAEDFDDPEQFDVAVGRHVLIHQADPAFFIRSAASHVRSGGIVAFHEIALYGECPVVPPVPVYSQVWDWIIVPLSSVMKHPDAAGRMMMHFEDAGLERPTVFSEIPVDGGEDSLFYAWAALSVRSLLPQIEAIGLATAAEVDIETLEDRLRKEALAERLQVPAMTQYCAWVTC